MKEIKKDTGKGAKSVADDLETVLKKIQAWHQGSIARFSISYRDTKMLGIRSPGTAGKRRRKKLPSES